MIDRDRERFHYEVRQLVDMIETRLRTIGQALMGMRDWYAMHPEMTEALWTNYVYTFHAPAHYPGLYSVGFAEKVLDKDAPNSFTERDAHLRRMRKRVGPEYHLHLPPGGIDGHSWYHMPITWHSYSQWRREPVRAFNHYGMDLNQIPDLWAAMNWALAQDVPALSTKQILDPGQPQITGLFIFLPVYRHGVERNVPVQLTDSEQMLATTPRREEEIKAWRRYSAFLRGLIFGSIDLQVFLEHHLKTNAPTVTFALYASTDQTPSVSPEHLIYDNRRSHSSVASLEKSQRSALRTESMATGRQIDLSLYGRVLRFVAEPGPAFNSSLNRRTLILAATFGLTTTLLLAGFIAYQMRMQQKEVAISSDLRVSEARLQALLHERERMSRDLHDGTIQSLYALGLGLSRLRKSLTRPEERKRLESSLGELDHVVGELRSYLVTLDPGVSPAQPATLALGKLVARLQQSVAAEIRFSAGPGLNDNWPPTLVLDLLQTTREGISNALRHGHSTQVEITLKQAAHGEVHLTICDNGKGFDPDRVGRKEGHGLSNLDRRARAWNGSLRVASRSGGPTFITLVVLPNVGLISEMSPSPTLGQHTP